MTKRYIFFITLYFTLTTLSMDIPKTKKTQTNELLNIYAKELRITEALILREATLHDLLLQSCKDLQIALTERHKIQQQTRPFTHQQASTEKHILSILAAIPACWKRSAYTTANTFFLQIINLAYLQKQALLNQSLQKQEPKDQDLNETALTKSRSDSSMEATQQNNSLTSATTRTTKLPGNESIAKESMSTTDLDTMLRQPNQTKKFPKKQSSSWAALQKDIRLFRKQPRSAFDQFFSDKSSGED